MNGWKNYETWNVSLHLRSNEDLFNIAKSCTSYAHLVNVFEEMGYSETDDGVKWSDGRVSTKEIDDLLNLLINKRRMS